MWSIILHGGAKAIDAKDRGANRKGCERALQAGIAILKSGGRGIDAAEAVVRTLEDDPTFNAGRGSARNARGEVETCAAMMEGSNFNVGAVAVAKGICNPISAAKAMLFKEPVLIAGDGARTFAAEAGVALCPPAALIAPDDKTSAEGKSHDTVGCIVLDAEGRFVTAVSTGGLGGDAAGSRRRFTAGRLRILLRQHRRGNCILRRRRAYRPHDAGSPCDAYDRDARP